MIEETKETEIKQAKNAMKITEMWEHRKSSILMIKVSTERNLAFNAQLQIDKTNLYYKLFMAETKPGSLGSPVLDLALLAQCCRDVLGSDLKTVIKSDAPQFNEIIKALKTDDKLSKVSQLLSERKYDIDQCFKQPIIDST